MSTFKKVAAVTYQIAVLHRRNKSITAHMNRLKAWNAPDASILRMVLADEVVEVEGKDEAEWQTLLEPQQSADVAQLLDEYSDRLNVSLG